MIVMQEKVKLKKNISLTCYPATKEKEKNYTLNTQYSVEWEGVSGVGAWSARLAWRPWRGRVRGVGETEPARNGAVTGGGGGVAGGTTGGGAGVGGEGADRPVLPPGGGFSQRRPSLTLAAPDVGVVTDEQLDEIDVARARGGDERRDTRVVGGIHVGAA